MSCDGVSQVINRPSPMTAPTAMLIQARPILRSLALVILVIMPSGAVLMARTILFLPRAQRGLVLAVVVVLRVVALGC